MTDPQTETQRLSADIPPPSPEQLQWILDHNKQIRGGHRKQIADAVVAWRADRNTLDAKDAKDAEARGWRSTAHEAPPL